MNATRNDFEQLLEAAQAARLTIEGGEILHSDDQGRFAEALVCIDKWLCWRDDALRIQIRVLARSGAEGSWECINEGAFSDPLTREQAFQLVAHWAALDRDAFYRNNDPRQRPVNAPESFKLSAVTFDCAPVGTAIPAYLGHKRWNGWRMPYFPESSIPQLLALFPDVTRHPDLDAYVIAQEDEPNDPWLVPAETITTADGQQVKVYPVGSGAWCWDEADLPTTPA